MLTKGIINRLGDNIRSNNPNIDNITLSQLQDYRIAHKETISAIFYILCSYSKKVNSQTIVTYRIKRFESIIGKLLRYPKMQLSRMWDIGGCRCILKNVFQVYKLKDLLEKDKNITIIKSYDYIKNPQKDGYKSLHLFVKHNQYDKTIEVQIRSIEDHNWATLVEITDVLFGSKIKEYNDNQELGRFHFLLSKLPELNLSERKTIADTIKKHGYFEKLSTVFSRNHTKVRLRWFEINQQYNYNYFLIETKKNEIPRIEPFADSTNAEERYFDIYKNSADANIVLIHLQNSNYSQMSIAYSNYILTFHSFMSECFIIIEGIIEEAIKKGKCRDVFRYYTLYQDLVTIHLNNLLSEVEELTSFIFQNKHCDQKARNKNIKRAKEWLPDINKEVENRKNSMNRLGEKFRNNIEISSLKFHIIIRIIRFIENKYKRKLIKI